MDLDLFRFGEILHEEQVQYLIIGGEAVNLYGVDRGTMDFDIWIDPEDTNTNNLTRALSRSGYIDSPDKKVTVTSPKKRTYSISEYLESHKLVKFEHANVKPLTRLIHEAHELSA
ncbi:MAG: hypothetical protein ABEJ65_02740 [bacterium]